MLITLYQQVHGLGVKQLDYEYDLVSGKVNFVRYQSGRPDQFYYQYKYDAENRLTEAWSGTQALVKPFGSSYLMDGKLDASYQYYLHGPLACVELGDQFGKVQGVDYAYTLQGWLKGVNGQKLDATNEMGEDGEVIAKDALAYSLGYYNGDYKPIGGTSSAAFGMEFQAQPGDITGQSLYNGNISNTTVAISKFRNGEPVGYSYKYDQLNRLKEMRQHELSASTTAWSTTSITDKYKESISYDGNGNILSFLRNGTTEGGNPLSMDNLTYGYSRDGNNMLLNNKLRHVKDVISSSNYAEDIDDQEDDNYSYDAIGNLIKDKQEGIDSIKWTVYGKIKSIYKSDGTSITYNYDPGGNRVSKSLFTPSQGNMMTWYIRDAQGNTLGVYDNWNCGINWKEQQLYGSSRLGMWKPNINLNTVTDSSLSVWDTIGKKGYELTNHLGNVMAVVSDRRMPVTAGSATTYEAEVVSAQDYYPFGMAQPGRAYQSSTYRYGFNGKENDNDVKATGNQQDYGLRIYDTRLGRFLSVDPYSNSYPDMSPYAAMGGNPILIIDPTGGFLIDVHKRITRNAFGQAQRKTTTNDIRAYRQVINGGNTIYSGSVTSPDVRTLPWYLLGGNKRSVPAEHFDDMNFGQVVNNYNRIQKNVTSLMGQYATGKMSAEALGDKVGEYFHAVQDLYSHSNYVELYEKTFGKTDVSLIPTFEEAMTQKKYSGFAKLLKTELKTGEYPGDGEHSHKAMNHDLGAGSGYGLVPEVKDKTVDWNSKAAEAVATKATKALNDKIEAQIK